MKYDYKCNTIDCKNRNVIITIIKPMSEAGKEEFCEECKNPLQKVYNSPAVKTGDGYKG